jgi:hypothetical protein
MTELIVDGFEVVDVQNNKRCRPACPAMAREFEFRRGKAVPAIGKAGQDVGTAEFLEPSVFAGLLCSQVNRQRR